MAIWLEVIVKIDLKTEDGSPHFSRAQERDYL